jgi:hypothetical protein
MIAWRPEKHLDGERMRRTVRSSGRKVWKGELGEGILQILYGYYGVKSL